MSVKSKFKVTDGYSSHRPLLLVGLQYTFGTVIEFGCGEGSTELLREYCNEKNRLFYSYENNKEYADKFGVNYIEDWNQLEIIQPIGLLFIDHAPGDQRKIDIERHANKADVIIVHDTEESSDSGYQMSLILSTFVYRIDYKPKTFAHTTAVSNIIDVSKWKIED